MTGHSDEMPVRAGIARRAAARLIDVLCILVLCALAWLAFGVAFAILAVVGQIDPIFGTRGEGLVVLLVVLMVGLALVLVFRYEVVSTARSGQTVGKRLMGVCVVSDPGPGGIGVEPPSRYSSVVRCAVPHGAALASAILSVVVAAVGVDAGWLPNSGFLLLPAGTFLALVWATCYVSALFGSERRGWHDKLAGTIVIRATDDVLESIAAGGRADGGCGPQRAGDLS